MSAQRPVRYDGRRQLADTILHMIDLIELGIQPLALELVVEKQWSVHPLCPATAFIGKPHEALRRCPGQNPHRSDGLGTAPQRACRRARTDADTARPAGAG